MSRALCACHPQPVERVLGAVQGQTPGPTLIVVGGVHGNEPAGLCAAQRVLDRLDALSLRGRFVALAGNLSALQADADSPSTRPRYLDADLNRLFTPAVIGSVREAEAGALMGERAEVRGLLDALEAELHTAEHGAFLLDLHTVSAASPPFLAIEDALPARRFARHFPVPIVLGMEEELGGLLMDHVTNAFGQVALVFEAGRHDDPASVTIHEAAIWVGLEAAGMIDSAAAMMPGDEPWTVLARAAGARAQRVYDLRYRVAIRCDDFAVRPGVAAFDRVHAERSIVADQCGGPVAAPLSGLVFMPNRQVHPRVGDDGLFIVRRVGWFWLWLSAQVRRWSVVHRILPRVLPGVRRCDQRRDCLLVAPEIAAVFKRELFHLLGYRLVRHGVEVHLSPWRRVAIGVGAVVRALGVMVGGIFQGGERAALGSIRDEDWIVTQHRLDRPGPAGCDPREHPVGSGAD